MLQSQNHSQFKFSKKEMLQEIEAILTGRWITDLANISAILMNNFGDINWVGFYLVPENEPDILWLGPFQGQPACTTIQFSKGVCGAAATLKKGMLIDDVELFPGHIVCDSRSKSEIAIPLLRNNQVIGVLDVDSTSLARFSKEDQVFFENVTQILLKKYS
jgi:L-methionine (R)-S-oxide reductase